MSDEPEVVELEYVDKVVRESVPRDLDKRQPHSHREQCATNPYSNPGIHIRGGY